MLFPEKILINEVCPRDGWQNINSFIRTEDKINLIKKMIDSGADEIEITSFVNPKWVPQFEDSTEVFSEIKKYSKDKNVQLIALVPNRKGAINAKKAGVEIINLAISVSESHNMKNVNRTISESLEDLRSTLSDIQGAKIRLALACVFGCPFGEIIPIDRILNICEEAYKIGISGIGLADSAGMSNPLHTRRVLKEIGKRFDITKFGVHFHDTRGMGMANAYIALEEGLNSFDTSLGGYGGCPFIPRAKGNIASEDFVNMVMSLGIKVNYNLDQMIDTAVIMEKTVGIPINSNLFKCMPEH
ncbi:MAG: hydroxymethylglutaryl-CoA lyase [Tissierellales bacterium]|nr:hydroxymethylglutaryl-CoA lyase [Tissierellales bacterium]MBN2828415.1 hydroxymethylglutaryl-CoA lyase [Tissierellales bacterium]